MKDDLRQHPKNWRDAGVCHIVAAGISAAAAIGGGLIASKGAKSAAQTQAAAAESAGARGEVLGREALDYQKGIDARTYGDLAKYREAGTTALPAYMRLLGQGPNGTAGIQTELESLPGYQFQQTQGVNAINRSLGGKGLTGAQSKGIARFVTGLADSTYGSQLDRVRGAVDLGVGAVNSGAGIGSATSGQVGGTLSGISQAIRDAITGAANASAGGTVGSANAITGGLTGAANSVGNAYMYSKLLGGSGGAPSGLYSGSYQLPAYGGSAA